MPLFVSDPLHRSQTDNFQLYPLHISYHFPDKKNNFFGWAKKTPENRMSYQKNRQPPFRNHSENQANFGALSTAYDKPVLA